MDMYLHVRVLFSIILGLGISRLLSEVARIVQHPKEYKVYWVHLLGAIPVPLSHSFLVVGIPASRRPAVDLPSLFIHRHLRSFAVPLMRPVLP
jgi:hypothetical protein